MKKITFLALITCCLMSTQCDEDEVVDFDNPCDEVVLIDAIVFENIQSDSFQFADVAIEGDCLNISIGASGCDGNSWSFALVDSGAVAESSPEQRFLKFELTNEEACLAVFNRTVSFNLQPLQINGSNTIVLNLEGWETSITYSY